MRRPRQSEHEEHAPCLLVLLRARLRLGALTPLVELRSADRAAIVVFEPRAQAVAVEGMLAGKLNAILALLARLEADVARVLFCGTFLGQARDVLL